MLIIKVNATDSTNLHLKRLVAETAVQDFTVLVANSQTQGRGQAGTHWISEPGKNLTISVLKYFEELEAGSGFRISQAVSLALVSVFRQLNIPDLAIKWPNDIMSGSRKICGILIENTLKGAQIAHAVIGMGINVNQNAFEGLPHAASLYQITGEERDPASVLDLLLPELQRRLTELEDHKIPIWLSEYDALLYLKDRETEFEIEGRRARAVIRGVSPEGKLRLQQGTDLTAYDLKEVAYLL